MTMIYTAFGTRVALENLDSARLPKWNNSIKFTSRKRCFRYSPIGSFPNHGQNTKPIWVRAGSALTISPDPILVLGVIELRAVSGT